MSERRIDTLIVVGLVLLCAFIHVALFLGYRHGFAFPDAWTLQRTAQSLLAWKPNEVDWARMPAFGMLLIAGKYLGAIVAPALVACATTFTCALILLFFLLRDLFASRVTALVLTLSVILFECTCGWVLFASTWMLADALCADLCFLGSIGVLWALLSKRRWPLVLASIAFGCALVLRPGNFVILVVWLPLLLLALRRAGAALSFSALCFAMFFAPLLFMLFHHWSLYRVVGVQAFGERALLARSMSLAREGDRVFDDSTVNTEFLTRIYRVRAKYGDSFEWYLWARRDEDNIIDALFSFTPDGKLVQTLDDRQILRENFQLRSLERWAALRLISLHPGTYLRGVFSRWMTLFNPYADKDFLRPFTAPQAAYDWMRPALSERIAREFYPPVGQPRAEAGDAFFVHIFPGFFAVPRAAPFLARHPYLPGAFVLLFFSVFFTMTFFIRRSAHVPEIFSLLLFLHTALTFLVIAVVHEPYARYAFSAELPLIASVLLALGSLWQLRRA